MKIKCENPVVILRHDAVYNFEHDMKLHVDCRDVSSRWVSFNFKWVASTLREVRADISKNLERYKRDAFEGFLKELDFKYRFVDVVTGEYLPVFQLVPCNHCRLCGERRRGAVSQRCQLECEDWSSAPLFVTLTYNDENLPYNGVQVRDCQLFMKRLRIRLKRNGLDEKLRYYIFSEYGSLRFRPHYHALIWCNWTGHFNEFADAIDTAWSLGFTHTEVSRNLSQTARYVSKYISKGSKVPTYVTSYELKSSDFKHFKNAYYKKNVTPCNSNFTLSSHRKGGIGVPFLHKLESSVYECLEKNGYIMYRSIHSNKVVRMQLYSPLINSLYPTLSRFVSTKVKHAVLDYKRYVDGDDTYIKNVKLQIGEFYDELVAHTWATLAFYRTNPMNNTPSRRAEVKRNLVDALKNFKFNPELFADIRTSRARLLSSIERNERANALCVGSSPNDINHQVICLVKSIARNSDFQ